LTATKDAYADKNYFKCVQGFKNHIRNDFSRDDKVYVELTSVGYGNILRQPHGTATFSGPSQISHNNVSTVEKQEYLDEANVLGIAAEALPAAHEPILPDQSMRVGTDPAAKYKHAELFTA
jgi:hypothetical protein